jgi:hypothetical protein
MLTHVWTPAAQFQAYKKEVSRVMHKYGKASEAELKRKHFDKISADYQRRFKSTKGHDALLCKASAWYHS